MVSTVIPGHGPVCGKSISQAAPGSRPTPQRKLVISCCQGAATVIPTQVQADIQSLRDQIEQQQKLFLKQQDTIKALKSDIASNIFTSNKVARKPTVKFNLPTDGLGAVEEVTSVLQLPRSGSGIPLDFRVLPERIFLVRHAESEGNFDHDEFARMPDSQLPLTAKGWTQARAAGQKIKAMAEKIDSEYELFFYISPYKRSVETYQGIAEAFEPNRIVGCREEVQLREQDFGNFQGPEGKRREKAERLRFGRFFYRFPNGESGADVYDRITLFEDHFVRDIKAGRFGDHVNLVLVTHGLALRVFLMRWLHWTVDQFLQIYNPGHAEPLILERVLPRAAAGPNGAVCWVHTKALYRLSAESAAMLRGCTTDMRYTSYLPRAVNPLERPFLEQTDSIDSDVFNDERWIEPAPLLE